MILSNVIFDLWHKMNRRKKLDDDILQTPLKRCVSRHKIFFLSTGNLNNVFLILLPSTFFTHSIPGENLILSFLLACFASFWAALCYAELVSRVPKAGSAYAFTYVFMNEYAAFFVGWSLILARIIGAASAAKAWSECMDFLVNGTISDYTRNITGGYIMGEPLTDIPDFLASGIYLIFALLLGLGVKTSVTINLLFTELIMIIGIITILASCLEKYYENHISEYNDWSGPNLKAIVNAFVTYWTSLGKNLKHRNIRPSDLNSVIKGAAVCFYAYIGIDSIATYGEEVRDPQSIPPVILSSMVLTIVGCVIAIIPICVPYWGSRHCVRNGSINSFTEAFFYKKYFFRFAYKDDFSWIIYITSVIILCGLTTILFNFLFSLSRMIYSMANDGLLFGFLGRINKRTRVPMFNIIISGLFGALITLLFDARHLIQLMLLGTLFACTIVAFDVIMLRCDDGVISKQQLFNRLRHTVHAPNSSSSSFTKKADPNNYINNIASAKSELLCQMIGKFKPRYAWMNYLKLYTRSTSKDVTRISLLVYTTICLFIGGFIRTACDSYKCTFTETFFTEHGLMWIYFISIITLVVSIILSIVAIAIYRKNSHEKFRVPFMPLVPGLSILFNIIIIMQFSLMTFIRFGIWTAIGIIYYFLYGIHHSKEGTNIQN